MVDFCMPEILLHPQHRDSDSSQVSELRNSLQQKIEENWPRKPHTFLYTPCKVPESGDVILPGTDRKADRLGNSHLGLESVVTAANCTGRF